MSLKVSAAAIRACDALRRRPGAPVRRSDARDSGALERVSARLDELIGSWRIGVHDGPGGAKYVFWTEVERKIHEGAFDDLLDSL